MWLELLNSAVLAHLLGAHLADATARPDTPLSAALRRLASNHRTSVALLVLANLGNVLHAYVPLSPLLHPDAHGVLLVCSAAVGALLGVLLVARIYSDAGAVETLTAGSSANSQLRRRVYLALGGVLGGVLGAWLVSRGRDSLPHTAMARVLTASITFPLLGAADARRHRPGLRLSAVVRAFGRATLLMAALLLPLSVGLAAVMLLLTALTDLAGVDHSWLNAPVEWVVLYGPWTAQYVLVQRACLREPMAALLPQ